VSCIAVLYRDEHLVVVVKPAGLLVHRTQLDSHEKQNLVDQLSAQLQQRVYPVHRLDKPTSGLLVMALSTDAARSLTGCFEQRKVTKKYHAVVRGYTEHEGTIDYAIGDKDARHNRRSAALSHYKTIATIELPHCIDRYPTTRYSLVEVEPVTGRRHQIRQHMKHINHPLIGDTSYGKTVHNRFFNRHYQCQRLLLHATGLSFIHPESAETLSFNAPATDDSNADDGQFARVLSDHRWCRHQRQP
jgi:tRNA pseudouridine65 synthase